MREVRLGGDVERQRHALSSNTDRHLEPTEDALDGDSTIGAHARSLLRYPAPMRLVPTALALALTACGTKTGTDDDAGPRPTGPRTPPWPEASPPCGSPRES